MSYTFTISATGGTVDIPTGDLTGVSALQLSLDKGGSSLPTTVTTGLVAGTKKVTVTIPGGSIAQYAPSAYSLSGTKAGSTVVLQTGVIRLSNAAIDDGATNVNVINPVTITGTVPTTPSGTQNVAVTGTPNVAVTNTPAVTVSGTATVSVSNTPAVTISGTPLINANGSAMTTQNVQGSAEPATSTVLAAGGTYTQVGVDTGATLGVRPGRVRFLLSHTAGQVPGTLFFEESVDNTTWRVTGQVPVPSDALYHSFEFPLHFRYYRARFLNGATAQTVFWLATEAIRGEGPVDVSKNLAFVLTATAGQALGASATFTGPTLDLGVNHNWNLVRALVKSDVANAANGLAIQQSADGAAWQTAVAGSNLAAGGTAMLEQQVALRYIRIINVNAATAATAFFATLALVSL